MNDEPEYLEEIEPYFLDDLGFARREQHTSDPDRLVEWFIVVPCEDDNIWHELVAAYELFITDDPYASYTDILNWTFTGVHLKTIHKDKRQQYLDFLAMTEGTLEDSDTFPKNGTIARTRLLIETREDLTDFIRKLAKEHPTS